MKDYYKILEISTTATDEEIHKSFRQLAQKYHPDRNPDPKNQERFRDINEAYQVLRDPNKRAGYSLDRMREQQSYAAPAQPKVDSQYRPPSYYQQRGGYAQPTRPSRNYPKWLVMVREVFLILLWAIVGAGIGLALVLAHSYVLSGNSDVVLPLDMLLAGGILGAVAGIVLPPQNALQLILKNKLKDTFLLFKAIGAGLSGVWAGGLIADILSYNLNTAHSAAFAITGMLLGQMVAGMAVADDEFWAKLRHPHQYFSLFFVLVRMASFALMTGLVGLFTAYALLRFAPAVDITQCAFLGVSIGLILGTFEPSDLRAYTRYASAYVGKWMVLLFVVLALIIGLALGIAFGPGIRGMVGL